MQSNYKPIGDYIQLVDERNKELNITTLLGLSISKEFIPSVANIVGTNMRNYKIIRKDQFACSIMQVRRDGKMPVALLEDIEEAIISQAYPVFEIIDTEVLLPQYLMMWFSRSEFDRQATFHAVGGVRGSLEWEDFLAFELPVPTIEQQREIVREYDTVKNRIKLNEQINQKLEETAQALYKHWFVEFEFPNEEGEPYKSNGGKMLYNEELDKEIPEGWVFQPISSYIEINSGYAFKSKWWTDRGLPVIKIGAIQNNSINEEELEFVAESNRFKRDNYRVQKGDIVLAMTGFTMGKIGLVPNYLPEFFVNQRVGFYKLNKGKNSTSGFLYCTLKTEDFKNEIWSFGGDSQQFNVSNNQVNSIKILQPINSVLIESFNSKTSILFEKIIESRSLERFLFKMKDLLLSKMTKVGENINPEPIENLSENVHI